MSGRVLSFLRRNVLPDWSTRELAEFYRVESALLQAGLLVFSDRGVTDEGDPWFVFCRAEDDEVIVHFARIGGRYLISAPAYGGDVTGYDFRALVCGLVERHPILQPARQRDNVTLHPSALLVVLVASALLKMAHTAEAASARPVHAAFDRTPLRVSITVPEHTVDTVAPETQQNMAILAAIAFATYVLDGSTAPV